MRCLFHEEFCKKNKKTGDPQQLVAVTKPMPGIATRHGVTEYLRPPVRLFRGEIVDVTWSSPGMFKISFRAHMAYDSTRLDSYIEEVVGDVSYAPACLCR